MFYEYFAWRFSNVRQFGPLTQTLICIKTVPQSTFFNSNQRSDRVYSQADWLFLTTTLPGIEHSTNAITFLIKNIIIMSRYYQEVKVKTFLNWLLFSPSMSLLHIFSFRQIKCHTYQMSQQSFSLLSHSLNMLLLFSVQFSFMHTKHATHKRLQRKWDDDGLLR